MAESTRSRVSSSTFVRSLATRDTVWPALGVLRRGSGAVVSLSGGRDWFGLSENAPRAQEATRGPRPTRVHTGWQASGGTVTPVPAHPHSAGAPAAGAAHDEHPHGTQPRRHRLGQNPTPCHARTAEPSAGHPEIPGPPRLLPGPLSSSETLKLPPEAGGGPLGGHRPDFPRPERPVLIASDPPGTINSPAAPTPARPSGAASTRRGLSPGSAPAGELMAVAGPGPGRKRVAGFNG
ncbi:MAG: hypothetical protein JWL99_2269 [Streptomyces oryziradicis]|nr:hypothetical protein [Actinacidiphila oryziradicis]